MCQHAMLCIACYATHEEQTFGHKDRTLTQEICAPGLDYIQTPLPHPANLW